MNKKTDTTKLKQAAKILIIISVWVVVWACGSEDVDVIAEYRINITPTGLTSDSMDVLEGGKVIWKNEDALAHTLVSGTKEDTTDFFRLGPIEPGEEAAFTFNSAGFYPYFSHIAPEKVKGIVIVEKDTVVRKDTDLYYGQSL